MTKVQYQTEINAPIEKVYEYYTNPDNIQKAWPQDIVKESENVSGSIPVIVDILDKNIAVDQNLKEINHRSQVKRIMSKNRDDTKKYAQLHGIVSEMHSRANSPPSGEETIDAGTTKGRIIE
jgi:carbon monoxide dehydrogenase subunit G